MWNQEKVKSVSYQAGDYIFREGAQCDSIFIVKSGQVEIYRVDNHRNKIPMALVQSGEYLGEMSLISDRPHSANAVALTETVCLKITSEILEEQLKQTPQWLVALTRGLVYKLHRTNTLLKRNGIVDESLTASVKAIREKNKKKAA